MKDSLRFSMIIFITEDRQSHFYIRTASGTREMDVQEALTFIRERWK